MDIEPHRAGRTYYPHSSVLLNLPNRDLEAFLNLQDWQLIVAAKFLDLPAVRGRQLSEFRPSIAPAGNMQEAVGLSMEQLALLTEKVSSGEITPQQFVEESNRMAAERRASSSSSSGQRLGSARHTRCCKRRAPAARTALTSWSASSRRMAGPRR